MNGDLVIDVRGVTKKFGQRTVVNNTAMQVRHGEIYGFPARRNSTHRK